MKIRVSAHCFTSIASKSGKTHCDQQSDKTDSVPVMHTRVLLMPPELTKPTQSAAIRLKRDPAPPAGAVKAYRESQSRIYKLEAPLFVGVGQGTNNLDFLADLSALKVIDPEEVARARPPKDKPVPRCESSLLQKLKSQALPYAHCAWCDETPKLGACSRSITMPFIMSCYSHHVVPLRQCSRLSWESCCDCDKGTLVPIPLIECFSEKD